MPTPRPCTTCRRRPVIVQRIGNTAGVMRMPNAPTAARCGGSSLTNGNVAVWCTVTWAVLKRESLPYAVSGWGVTTMHNEPAALSRGLASCSVPLLLFIFSWVKLGAELVSTEQARCRESTVGLLACIINKCMWHYPTPYKVGWK